MLTAALTSAPGGPGSASASGSAASCTWLRTEARTSGGVLRGEGQRPEHKVLRHDLESLFRDDPALAKRCRTFCADRGCDGGPLNAWLWDARCIRPVIDARLAWREDWDAMSVCGDLPKLRPRRRDRPDNMLHSERGELFCRCPAAWPWRGLRTRTSRGWLRRSLRD